MFDNVYPYGDIENFPYLKLTRKAKCGMKKC